MGFGKRTRKISKKLKRALSSARWMARRRVITKYLKKRDSGKKKKK